MKKKSIINLVKYHADKNDVGFRNEAYEIAKEFEANGDSQLAEYIMSVLSDVNSFVPQSEKFESNFLEKIDINGDMLLLPDAITHDVLGLIHAVERNIGVNKFLFQGAPGTGKTETVKQLARILNRELYMVDFSSVIDSKLGQTQKNISWLFDEIDSFYQPERIIVLFDEIDALALDRTNSNDHREMGRVTSTLLKCLDRVNESVVLIATTNLIEYFDRAVLRRFDSIVDFNRYSAEDVVEIAEKTLNRYLVRVKLCSRDVRLFRKIMNQSKQMLYPGEIKNIIKSAVAFSDKDDGTDYLRRLYYSICGEQPSDLRALQQQGFTVREIEILTKKSKSSVSRELKDGILHE